MELPDLCAAAVGRLASGGRRKQAKLSGIPSSWIQGANAPSVSTGAGGLGTQAQHLLSNLTHNLSPHRAQIAEIFGKRPQISITALVAFLCGIHRETVRHLIHRVDEGGQDAVRAPLVRAGPGRKRLRDRSEATASASDHELPDLRDHDSLSDADGDIDGVGSLAASALPPRIGRVASVRHAPGSEGLSFATQGVHAPAAEGLSSATQGVHAPTAEGLSSASQGVHAPAAEGLPIETTLPMSRSALRTRWAKCSTHEGSSLQDLPLSLRDQTIGIRLGSLVASLIVQGSGTYAFPKWLHMLDSHFPGEWGQINHSRHFAENFADGLMRACARNVMEHAQQRVRALNVPSDYVRILDGITPQMGESLLIHVIISVSREDGHTFKWGLLDLTPQGRTSPSVGVERELGRDAPKGLLSFHGLTRTLDKAHAAEAAYGIGLQDRRLRFAVHVGDGALEGPFGLKLGDESARRSKLPPNKGWGALDGLHALDKAGAAADASEPLVQQFHASLASVRSSFGFGNGKVVVRSIAKKFHLPWRRPIAPHTQSTRMIVYESYRCPVNLFRNLRCIVLALRFTEKEAVENARRQSRSANPRASAGWNTKAARSVRLVGRNLLDPCMLLFVQGRYEFRSAGLLAYAPASQSLVISGLEKQLLLERVDARMRTRIALLRSMLTSLHILFLYSKLISDTSMPWISLRAFYSVVLQRMCGRHWPGLCADVLEVLFDRTFHSLPLGLKADTNHPFAEPQARPPYLGAHRRDRVVAARLKTIEFVTDALTRLHKWACNEHHHTTRRLIHWDAKHGAASAPEGLSSDPQQGSDPVAGTRLDPEADLSAADDDEVASGERLCELDGMFVRDHGGSSSSDDSSSSSSSSSSDDSSSSSSSSKTDDLVDARAVATRAQCVESFDLVGQASVVVERGQVFISSGQTARLRRWSRTLEGYLPLGSVGIRKQILMCGTEAFHCNWLLSDWRFIPDICRLSLLRLYNHFKDLLWGIDPEDCPFDDPPPELFQSVSFEELWSQYLRLNILAKDTQPERYHDHHPGGPPQPESYHDLEAPRCGHGNFLAA